MQISYKTIVVINGLILGIILFLIVIIGAQKAVKSLIYAREVVVTPGLQKADREPQETLILDANTGRCGRCNRYAVKHPHIHYDLMPIRWVCATGSAEQSDTERLCEAHMTIEVSLYNPTQRSVVFERVGCWISRRTGPELSRSEHINGRHRSHSHKYSDLLLPRLTFRVRPGTQRLETFRLTPEKVRRETRMHFEKPFCNADVRHAEDLMTITAP